MSWEGGVSRPQGGLLDRSCVWGDAGQRGELRAQRTTLMKKDLRNQMGNRLLLDLGQGQG